MNVLVLHGSAHKGGSTDLLASRFLEGLGPEPGSVAHFRPSDMAIAHCRACGSCDATGRCAIDDDMRDVYPAFREARVVVLAAPMFWGYMTSQLKTLFDRLEAAASSSCFGGKAFVLLLAYRHYYGSMVEWMTRVTGAFGSTLHWMGARTYDPATEADIPVSEQPDKLAEARELGAALRESLRSAT